MQESKGSNNYPKVTNNVFPNKGYLLNPDKTKCTDYNGSNVPNAITQNLDSYGSIDGTITLKSNKSIFCNIYFDIDSEAPIVTSFTISGNKANTSYDLTNGYTQTSKVNYSVGWNASDVTAYCINTTYSIVNCTWIKATSTSGTLNNQDVSVGVNKRYAFVKDKANNISEGMEGKIAYNDLDPVVSISGVTSTKDTITFTMGISSYWGVVSKSCWAEANGETINGEITPNEEIGGNTCTISGLTKGTSYTIYAKAVDISGRYGKTSKIISTLPSYTCPIGTIREDAKLGRYSGGYICAVSAEDQGWINEETYWTCSATSDQYSTEDEAKSACTVSTTGTCSERTIYYCKGVGYGTKTAADAACTKTTSGTCSLATQPGKFKCSTTGTLFDDNLTCTSNCTKGTCSRQNGTFVYKCSLDNEIYPSIDPCESACKVTTSLGDVTSSPIYVCSLGGSYNTSSSCSSNCYGDISLGDVLSHSTTSYYCDKNGWYFLSEIVGVDNSLMCWKHATKE